MNDKLYNKLLELPKKNLLHLMLEALGEMQAYNGRPIDKVIFLTMGGKLNDDETMWTMPSLKTIKANTENIGL